MVPMISHTASKTDPIFIATTCPADTPRFPGNRTQLAKYLHNRRLNSLGGIADHPHCPQVQVPEVDECQAKRPSARSSHSGRALGVVRVAGCSRGVTPRCIPPRPP